MYYRVYWISDTALAAFAFLATYELFFKRLFPGFYKTRFYRLLFQAGAIIVTIMVALSALSATTGLRYLTLDLARLSFFMREFLLFFVALDDGDGQTVGPSRSLA